VNRPYLRQRPARRRNPLSWLFGPKPPKGPTPVVLHSTPPAAQPEDPIEEQAEAPPPPELAAVAVASEDLEPRVPVEEFRVNNVSLPANLELEGEKVVPVRLTNISGGGAAMLYDSPEPLPDAGGWLDLALPNRAKALEVEVKVARRRIHMGPQGQDQQIVHVSFPSIRRNDQDAIIAYVNNIRLYENKQYTVAAKVMLEVVTGRRRFAKFTGETVEIRPDMMRLLMDDFDAIVGAEVMLTVMAPKFADHIDVEDVKVEKVEVISPRKAEVEVSLANPDDKVLLFIRKHYPGVAKGRR